MLCASPGVTAVPEPREAELEQGTAARSHPAEEPSSTVPSQQSPDFRCFRGSRSHRALSASSGCSSAVAWAAVASSTRASLAALCFYEESCWAGVSGLRGVHPPGAKLLFVGEKAPKQRCRAAGQLYRRSVVEVSGAWYFTIFVADRGTHAVHGLNLVQPSVKHRRRSGCAGAEALGRGFWA